MIPEATAYEHSPHARVACVECHVGSGAGWYIHAKVNGMRQLAGVIFNTYDRPIPTPIKGLRPARDTCEACHWPQKHWGSQLYQRPHFRYDEKSTPEQITMLDQDRRRRGAYGAGIHWHMAIGNKVTYVAEDDHLQEIPWVEGDAHRRQLGGVLPHREEDRRGDAGDPDEAHDGLHGLPQPAGAQLRHPGHRRRPRPRRLGDLADAPVGEDARGRDAVEGVPDPRGGARRDAEGGHRLLRGEVSGRRRSHASSDIGKLADALGTIYDGSVFPEMKVSWKTYPSNLGHRNSAGCFRCHDGKHVSADGKVLISECKACHTTPQRGPQSGMGEAMTTTEKDWHPWQTPEKHLAVEKHKDILCHECHLAGRKPKTECNECHSH